MKIINRIILLTGIIISLALYSCDEITKDYLETKGTVKDDTTFVKKALIEDYTGFTCGNCPYAHEEASRLHELFGENLIVLAIHSSYYAKPTTAHPYDFRTETATEWDNFFGVSFSGLPNGMVNRRGYLSGNHTLKHDSWQQTIDEVLSEKPIVSLEISAVYLKESRQILAFVTYMYNEKLDKYHNLNVCIVEDSIVQYQKWYRHDPEDVEDYVHNHVFRAALNGTWGEKLNTQLGIKTYSYTLPDDSDWRHEKLKIVAFISDVGNTFEVLQAGESEIR
ncbi:MAG: Omp28 family outer membrane lipoprotein [bacterium]